MSFFNTQLQRKMKILNVPEKYLQRYVHKDRKVEY